MTVKEFLAFAISRGYRAHTDASGIKPDASAYAYKRAESTRICEINGRSPEIVLYFYAGFSRMPPAIEADIYGMFGGLNRKIEIYGKTQEETVAQIEEIEAALVRMWEA